MIGHLFRLSEMCEDTALGVTSYFVTALSVNLYGARYVTKTFYGEQLTSS